MVRPEKVSPSESVPLKVREFLTRHGLVGVETRLLVAVSGGPDSVCLLHTLAVLQKEFNIELYAAHLDHGLRAKESQGDARYVERLCKKLGVPVIVEKRDVASFQTRNKLSMEEAARVVRYGFFTAAAHSVGTDIVAVAHTNNDHIETVLMHLIRGSGIRGLQGLLPVNRWRSGEKSITVVRPLLNASREDTVNYCRTKRLRPRIDSSNLTMSTFRNRIRLELLPLLEKYNSRIVEALKRASSQAAETVLFLNKESRRGWDKVVRQEEGGFLLDKSEFLNLEPVLKKNLLLLMLEKLLGGLSGIESRHLEEIISALNLPAGRRLDLPDNLVFVVNYDNFILSRGAEVHMPLPPLEGISKLKIPGEIHFSGWRIMATMPEGLTVEDCKNQPFYSVIPADTRIQGSSGLEAYLDIDKTGRELEVRSLKPGDSFQPLGMGKTKKVARFMIDARIPRHWRDHVPIVASPRQIVWVAGWRIDDRVKITEGTRNLLKLEFRRIA